MKHPSHLSAECELLLCCSRTFMDPVRTERVRELSQQTTEWSRLVRMSESHGVVPLLYRNLNAACPELVPGAIIDELRVSFHSHALRAHLLTQELVELTHAFESFGIEFVPLKGPALANAVYGSIQLRQYTDLDILVRKRDAVRSKKLLVSRGYRPMLNLNEMQTEAFLRFFFHYQFASADERVRIELHWGIVETFFGFPTSMEEWWKRMQVIGLDGTDVLAFSPEDQLAYYCVHGAKHRWRYLLWICDICELLRTFPNLDWERIRTEARKEHTERMITLGLSLAGCLLGAPVPESIQNWIGNDPKIRSLAEEVSRELFPDSHGNVSKLNRVLPGLEVTVDDVHFHLKIRERMKDRLLYCIRTSCFLTFRWFIPNERDEAFFPLPPHLASLRYLLRPIRLITEFGASLIKRLIKSNPAGVL